ncbi:hypothetical protein BDN70DRAFT_991563 [Pholiota conissans]|uniref:Uncharacterized protein n=1 Tax=Pholiota conissans TaxID=109636 RepID=A0A9P5Z659_9AGAR|nr:hypothetical protein BDN70DRAFT_991563 [Pholiota conissans]
MPFQLPRYRTYWVKSLHVSTYQQSKNFLERFRLRALIIELIETDPDGTNLENRTVDWVIRRYYAEIHPRDQSQHHIASEHLGDSIVGWEPRHLRHISHAEICGWFAKHATWLLAYQIASNSPNSRLLAIPQWVSFCKQAQMDSINAGHKGVKWGQQTEDDALKSTRIYDLPNQLANFGQTIDFWSQKLKNASQRTEKLKTMHYSKRPLQSRPLVAVVPHCQQTFQYDSEFSNATTSESSESDSELLSYSSQILQTLHTPPAIQTGYFIWHCQLCAHAIDLLSIPVDYLEILPHQIIHILNTKSWNVNDDPVKEALYLMVSHHHKTAHFHAAGLHFSKKGSNFYLEGASSNPRKHKKVKIEEGEPILN